MSKTTVKLILWLLLAPASGGPTDNAAAHFQQRGKIFVQTETIHVSLDFQFQHVRHSCDTSKEAMERARPYFASNTSTDLMLHRFDAVQKKITSACDFPLLRKDVTTKEARQALLLAAGAAAAVGGIMGLFNKAENSRISHRVDKMEDLVHADLVVLRSHQTRLDSMYQDLREHNAALSLVDEELERMVNWVEMSSLLDSLETNADTLESHIDVLRRGWISIAAERLPLDLLDAEHLQTLLKNLNKQAQKLRGTPVLSTIAQLAELQTTFILDNEKIRVMGHVAVAKQELDLYEQLDTPLQQGAQFVSVSAKSGAKYIAVAEHNTYHVELTFEELNNKCSRRGKVYICSFSFLHKDMDATCLGSAYIGSSDGIQKWCRIDREERPWTVERTGHQSFSIYVASDMRMAETCNGQRVPGMWRQGTHNVTVTSNCAVDSDHFLLLADAGADLLMTIEQEVDIMDEELLLKGTHHRIPLPNLTEVEDGRVMIRDDPLISNPHVIGVWTAVGLGALSTALAFTILCCLFFRFRKNKNSAGGPGGSVPDGGPV
jgi:hypothetical protein